MLGACSPGSTSVERTTLAAKDFGDAWPFTAPAVGVVCAGKALFVTVGGKGYALNGEADRRHELYPSGEVSDISEIQRPDPDGAGVIPGEGRSLATVTAAAIRGCAESKK